MICVWPQYIDKNLTLSEGRKIAKKYAVKEPSLSEIEHALKKLKLPYNIQKEKSYPGKWYKHSGRILVESDKTKLDLLKEISLKQRDRKSVV